MRGKQEVVQLYEREHVCFGNAAAICEEDEKTCSHFRSCGQAIIDQVMEALGRTIREETIEYTPSI